jgi:translation initiation factor IF-3
MDFGKFKYEAAMKAREARKNQVNTVIKEIKLRPKIDPHDYGTKKGHVERFLKAGDKVKVTIMFRGREQSRPELGRRLLERLAEDIAELGFVESAPKQDGRNMIMVIGPTKKKAEAKAEQRRSREQHEHEQQEQHEHARRPAEQAAPSGEQPEAQDPQTEEATASAE